MTPVKRHNDSLVTEGNFRDVKVHQVDVVFNSNKWPLEYSCYWCGRTAFFVVSRTSVMTGRTYSDHACTECSRRWVAPTRDQMAFYHRTQWKRMQPGHYEQFVERVSESKKAHAAKLSLQERREMTAPARAAAAAKRAARRNAR